MQRRRLRSYSFAKVVRTGIFPVRFYLRIALFSENPRSVEGVGIFRLRFPALRAAKLRSR
jgi:hypothetical protein